MNIRRILITAIFLTLSLVLVNPLYAAKPNRCSIPSPATSIFVTSTGLVSWQNNYVPERRGDGYITVEKSVLMPFIFYGLPSHYWTSFSSNVSPQLGLSATQYQDLNLDPAYPTDYRVATRNLCGNVSYSAIVSI